MTVKSYRFAWAMALPFVALAACNNKGSSAAVDASTPYLSLSVREEDRLALLDTADLLQQGMYAQAKSNLASIEKPDTVRIGLSAEGTGAEAAKKAVEEAAKIWNEAMKGAVTIETGASVEDADLAIYLEPTVMEVHSNYTAPGCSNLTIKTQEGGRKGELKVAASRPGATTEHSPASLLHLVSKGIAGFLGLARDQKSQGLMGQDTHIDTVPVKPSDDEVKTLLQLFRYEKALSDSAEAKAKPSIEFPALKLESTEKDLGEAWRGESIHASFPYKNEGNSQLEIDVKPACGCTVAKFDKVLAPGQSGTIEVDFATAGFSGKSSKHIDIFTNSPSSKNAKITFTANVKPTFDVQPTGMVQIPLNDSGPTSYALTIKPLEPEGAAVQEVSSTGKYLTGKVEKAGDAFKVNLTVAPDVPNGRTVQSLKVKTTSKREPEFNISVALDKGIVAIPSACYFGYLKGDEKFPMMRNIQIQRKGRPFKITKVDAGDPKLSTEVKEAKPGSEYILKVTFQGGWPQGTQTRTIVVHTDDPKVPKIELAVQATVR